MNRIPKIYMIGRNVRFLIKGVMHYVSIDNTVTISRFQKSHNGINLLNRFNTLMILSQRPRISKIVLKHTDCWLE